MIIIQIDLSYTNYIISYRASEVHLVMGLHVRRALPRTCIFAVSHPVFFSNLSACVHILSSIYIWL